jgi:type IV pilus assembly protein PilM
MPSKTIVGLDIGSTHIRGVEAIQGDGPLKIKAMASIALPHGVIELGDIKDSAAFTKALKDLWQKGKFTTKDVRIVSNSQSNITRLITLDWERDFKKTLPFKLKGEGMFDAAEYYFGYHTIQEYMAQVEDRTSAEGFKEVRKKDILLAGSRRETTDSMINTFKAAGLKPVSIDMSPLALIRAERSDSDSNDAIDIHINIGASITTVVISLNDQPIYLRSIADVGGNTITKKILQALPHADFEYAEKIKFDSTEMLPVASVYDRPASMFDDEDEDDDTNVAEKAIAAYSRDQMDVYPIIVEEVSAIIDNIHQSIEYFINTNRMGIGRNINKIFLSGGTARFSQIRSRLEREIGSGEAVYTQPLTYLANTAKGSFDKKYLEKEFDYVLPIGALLGNGDTENG